MCKRERSWGAALVAAMLAAAAMANPTVRVERIAGPDVTVAVKISNLGGNQAAGYQIFLQADPSRLTLNPLASQYVTNQFALPIVPIASVNGRVSLAAGVFPGAPTVNADCTVATLRFVAADPTCIPEVFLPPDAQPPTRLSTNTGMEIGPLTLVSMARICVADFDQNQVVEINDIFVFLNAWFAGSCAADMNGGGVEINDIFIFLNAWFTGCP